MQVKHKFTSGVSDDPAAVTAGKVVPSKWNQDHDFLFAAASKIAARKTSGAGAAEECSLSEILDFIGSAAQGDLLYRGTSAWARLPAGTSGQFLKTQGTGANPAWASLPSGGALAGLNSVDTAHIDDDAVTYAKLQNISAQYRILGRKTSGAGNAEECTLSELLDFVTSAAQGDILFRGASGWQRLAAGTSGNFLKTLGAGADPTWAALTSPVEATQAEMEAATNNIAFASPRRIISSPVVAKAWAYVDIVTSGSPHYTTIAGFGMTAVNSGSSNVRLQFDTAMSSTNYGVLVSKESGTVSGSYTRNTGYVEIGSGDFIGTVTIFGDQ